MFRLRTELQRKDNASLRSAMSVAECLVDGTSIAAIKCCRLISFFDLPAKKHLGLIFKYSVTSFLGFVCFCECVLLFVIQRYYFLIPAPLNLRGFSPLDLWQVHRAKRAAGSCRASPSLWERDGVAFASGAFCPFPGGNRAGGAAGSSGALLFQIAGVTGLFGYGCGVSVNATHIKIVLVSH